MARIHERLLEALAAHPAGATVADLRQYLGLRQGEQEHLNRRIRDLDRTHVIQRVTSADGTKYVLVGKMAVPLDATAVDRRTRARILFRDGSRCQMCGMTPTVDGVRLHVDHRVPREWGGTTDEENLWTLCSDCNQGKKDFFATIDDPDVRAALSHESVHVRIGELLKAKRGEPIPKELIQVVAHTHDDWEKRLRELRELGWRYRVERRKQGRRIRTAFALEHSEPWPEDPAAAIRTAELGRKARRRVSSGGKPVRPATR